MYDSNSQSKNSLRRQRMWRSRSSYGPSPRRSHRLLWQRRCRSEPIGAPQCYWCYYRYRARLHGADNATRQRRGQPAWMVVVKLWTCASSMNLHTCNGFVATVCLIETWNLCNAVKIPLMTALYNHVGLPTRWYFRILLLKYLSQVVSSSVHKQIIYILVYVLFF